MGKVVKYCTACDEGFAEKFGFCPNCGAQLQAFELNPVEAKAPVADAKPAPPPAPPVVETPTPVVETPAPVVPVAAEPVAPTIPVFSSPVSETTRLETPVTKTEIVPEIELPAVEEPVAEVVAEPEPVYATAAFETPAEVPVEKPVAASTPYYVPDGGYAPTIVYEKNVGQRNMLLLGAFALGTIALLGSYVFSMFNKYLDIAAIDTPGLVSYVEEVEPTDVEVPEPEKKNNDKGGGGGGGGKEEDTPTSKGRLATQVDKPFIAPDVNMTRVTDPAIAYRASTQGTNQTKQTDEDYGLPNGGAGRSNGTGRGGGQGEGDGTGQGNGRGTGQGNGNGSGSGNGLGNGNGDGTGDGDGDTPALKPPKPVGPTEGVKILSKPRANYTDAARQANVQGKVVLRVTFSANGTIGAISVISGLGSGLTEQAIAAARGIRFEPAKKGGEPYSVTRPVEYSFTIY